MIVQEIEQICTLFNGDAANQCKDLLDTYLGDVIGYLIQQLVSIIKLDSYLLFCLIMVCVSS